MTEPEKIRYHSGELGWALPREDGTYTIDNLPFDGGLVQIKDVVECREPTDPTLLPFVARIVQRTLHAWSVVRYWPATRGVYTALRRAVEAAGGSTEGSVPGTMVVASNVEDETELYAILDTATYTDDLLAESATGKASVRVVQHIALPPAPVVLVGLDPDYGALAPTAGRPGPAIVPR